MKLLLFAASLIIVVFCAMQSGTDSSSDLTVEEFSWSPFKGIAPPVKGAVHNQNDSRARHNVIREQMENRNSIENRSRDLSDLENRVRRDAITSTPINLFRYKVRVKNTGLKVVKTVSWDYQVRTAEGPDHSSHRQFRCTTKIKPNQTETMEAFTTVPPVRTVVVGPDGAAQEKLVINRVEFADGTSWQRPDWQAPDETTPREGRGKCQPL